jgi:hypothetical protein
MEHVNIMEDLALIVRVTERIPVLVLMTAILVIGMILREG